MKIHARIIPEGFEVRQKKTGAPDGADFASVLRRVMASGEAAPAPEEAPLPGVPEELVRAAEEILSRLDAPASDAQGLRDLSRGVLEKLDEVPVGAARALLEEIALLGAVEAERRLL